VGYCAERVICYALKRFSAAVNSPTKAGSLIRGLGLKEAVALNMIDMVGIGPFIVTPLVAQAMGGPQCLLAWVVGAAMALLDGFIPAELARPCPKPAAPTFFCAKLTDQGDGAA
jgi:amino acid transporter